MAEKCNSWTCPICRWGKCVGNKEAAKEFGWCDKEEEKVSDDDYQGLGNYEQDILQGRHPVRQQHGVF